MVDIAPFPAIRYTANALDPLLAPPYDVIGPELQDQLYARHPHNIVRIDLTKAEPGDGPLTKYERASRTLAAWLAEGVLGRDAEPAIYVLSQTFTGPDGVERTRTGFFSRVRLSPWDDGPILPHERTLRGPKVDRLELFRATEANLSPIFGAYQDPDGAVGAFLEEATRGAPVVDARMDGVQNRLWRVAKAEALVKLFAPKKLYIADGHHRYETALAYRDERRKQAGRVDPDAAFEHVLMFSAAVEDPGMVIFPTHRLVHGLAGFDAHALLAKLAPFFLHTPAPEELASQRTALAEAGVDRANAYLLATRSGRWILRSKGDAPWSSVPALPSHPALQRLDVSVLHAVVLEHALGITREAQATQANLRYSKDFKEAVESPAKDPSVEAAFLMNPTKIEEVIAVAESGEVMPQKSTFFYPKVPSGLLIYPLA